MGGGPLFSVREEALCDGRRPSVQCVERRLSVIGEGPLFSVREEALCDGRRPFVQCAG